MVRANANPMATIIRTMVVANLVERIHVLKDVPSLELNAILAHSFAIDVTQIMQVQIVGPMGVDRDTPTRMPMGGVIAQNASTHGSQNFWVAQMATSLPPLVRHAKSFQVKDNDVVVQVASFAKEEIAVHQALDVNTKDPQKHARLVQRIANDAAPSQNVSSATNVKMATSYLMALAPKLRQSLSERRLKSQRLLHGRQERIRS